jgi:phage shock protein A
MDRLRRHYHYVDDPPVPARDQLAGEFTIIRQDLAGLRKRLDQMDDFRAEMSTRAHTAGELRGTLDLARQVLSEEHLFTGDTATILRQLEGLDERVAKLEARFTDWIRR